ncbi:DUF2256 domain-containing protein [Microbulbifer yueqingensis]|uniref:DUF2256 domain-containing protein n=1 Tax=Microbulbifer yueqingensis TaxID=658219 RepID=A0A1G8YGF0_9GAMM|nr:DUF2256 domain-containing protein [Microbulbifer yueqingensis]SDK01908.1 hypothetical protein SAMN05216212_1488 [Microbulbifer yueqingensis]
MAQRTPELPQKTCPVCGRPFRWRKKWAACWERVKYCSERCRRNRRKSHDRAAGKEDRQG